MQKPVNQNASPEAAALLNYLEQTAGHGIITGQHTHTNPMEEITYIREITGKQGHIKNGYELGKGIRWDRNIFLSLVFSFRRQGQKLLCGAY